jgi:hypothetical protein
MTSPVMHELFVTGGWGWMQGSEGPEARFSDDSNGTEGRQASSALNQRIDEAPSVEESDQCGAPGDGKDSPPYSLYTEAQNMG